MIWADLNGNVWAIVDEKQILIGPAEELGPIRKYMVDERHKI